MAFVKRIFLFAAAAILALAACTTEEEGASPLPPPPVITLDSESSIYATKIGREIEIRPTYENADDASFAWTMQGRLLGEEPTLRFAAEEAGRYFILLKVSNAGGSAEEELRVDVLSLTPPTITLPEAYDDATVLLLGSSLELRPAIASSLETACRWTVDGREVSTDRTYTFLGERTGEFRIGFETRNEDGEDAVELTVRVLSPDEVDFTWSFEQEVYNVAKGRSIRLRAIDIENAFDAEYRWKIGDREVQRGDSPAFVFDAAQEGSYAVTLEMHNRYLTASHELRVNVCPAEGTYRRTAAGTAACNRVYEFLPAPGQFVNENYTATTMAEACAYAEGRLAQTAYVSLGGFGGYLVVGFDHSIANEGEYNIAVTGNAFDGSSEPGIVWVMQDENGDGLPNDTWYELKGSEYGKPETDQEYAVTYYRPGEPGQSVAWTDNRGRSGTIEYLGAFHRQDYYYPAWVAADSYTLRGTCLEARNYDQSGNGTYWVNPAYDWGYVDNFSSIDRLTDDDNYNAAPSDNHFRISDAVTFDGRPAELKYVDFVKIQVGINAQSGWLGEVSTEVFGVKDFNMLR